MTVYFAQLEDEDLVKIGYTASVDASARIAQLQTGQPKRIKLIGTIPGGKDAEAGLHLEFLLNIASAANGLNYQQNLLRLYFC